MRHRGRLKGPARSAPRRRRARSNAHLQIPISRRDADCWLGKNGQVLLAEDDDAVRAHEELRCHLRAEGDRDRGLVVPCDGPAGGAPSTAQPAHGRRGSTGPRGAISSTSSPSAAATDDARAGPSGSRCRHVRPPGSVRVPGQRGRQSAGSRAWRRPRAPRSSTAGTAGWSSSGARGRGSGGIPAAPTGREGGCRRSRPSSHVDDLTPGWCGQPRLERLAGNL